jgi:integrase/recombinase XerD
VTHLRKAMLEELQRRNLSQITIRIYLRAVEEFAQYFKMSPDRLQPEHIRQYQAHLSQQEVERLIQCAGIPLHRVWLLILYATGMRREELVRLKIGDIDSNRMLIRIRQGKGKKDRDVNAQS